MGQHKRKIRVQARRREQPDVPKLARALIALAQAEAERAAQAEHEGEHQSSQDSSTGSAA